MTDGRSTNAVFRKLQTWVGLHTRMGDALIGPTTTQEQFVKNAKAWLGDRTEIRSQSLENADWTQIYQYFKSYREDQDRDPAEKKLRQEAAQELIAAMETANRVLQPGLWYAATLLDPTLNHFKENDD